MKIIKNLSAYTVGLFHEKLTKRYIIWSIIFWAGIFIIFFLNTFHEKYPDEFDNILGGKYILSGLLPYIGFFSHHGPVAYFVAGIIQIFTGFSFVSFRIGYSILLFLIALGTFLFLSRSVGTRETKFYYIFVFLLGCAGTYYWLHMLLADSLSAFFILPVFGVLLLKGFYKMPLRSVDLVIISVCTFLMIFTSVTFLYVACIVYALTLYLYKTNEHTTFVSTRTVKVLIIFIIPVFCFLLYLLLTGSFSAYIQQSLIFNQRYYIYNYPGAESGVINPIRYGVMTLFTFLENYHGLFVQIPHFNLAFPLNITFAIGNIFLIIYLILKRHYVLAASVFLILVFSNMRSQPLDSSEKDYQAAVYIVISLFSLSFIVTKLYEDISKTADYRHRLIFSGMFMIVFLYFFAAGFFLFQKSFSKAFSKYMGQSPLIYDRPEIAPILHTIISADKSVWIGPLEFEEQYYLDLKPPTRYHFLIPAMGRSPQARGEMIAEISESKPDVIWFDKNYSVLGQMPEEYAPFFTEYVDKNYSLLGEITENGSTYRSQIPRTDKVDLEAKLYLRNDRLEDILNLLLNKNLIEKSSSQQ